MHQVKESKLNAMQDWEEEQNMQNGTHANVSTLTETDKDDERILTVESTGALSPEQIILAGVDEVSNKLVVNSKK